MNRTVRLTAKTPTSARSIDVDRHVAGLAAFEVADLATKFAHSARKHFMDGDPTRGLRDLADAKQLQSIAVLLFGPDHDADRAMTLAVLLAERACAKAA